MWLKEEENTQLQLDLGFRRLEREEERRRGEEKGLGSIGNSRRGKKRDIGRRKVP